MTTLEDEVIKTIVKEVAEDNHVALDKKDIATTAAIDSAGQPLLKSSFQ